MSSSTLIFAVPQSPPAKFVSAIHDSDLMPRSISRFIGWWTQPEASQEPLLWTNLVVLPGEDTQLPNDSFKMQDSWTVNVSQTSDDVAKFDFPTKRLELVAGHFGHCDLSPTAQQLGRGKAIIGGLEHWPESLKEFQKRSQAFLHENSVLTMHLVAISDTGVREQYEDFIKFLFDVVDTKENVEIHAAGSITSSSGNAPGTFNKALVLRYAHIEDFVVTLKAGWSEQLVQSHGVHETFTQASQILVQEIWLPGKGTKLNIHQRSWPYGDPYQHLGECWFG